MSQQTSIENAKHILGTVLLDPGAFWRVGEMLQPIMFPEDWREVAEVVWSRAQGGKGLDFGIVSTESGRDVSELRDFYTQDITDHAESLREDFMRRNVGQSIYSLTALLSEKRPVAESMQQFWNEYDLLNSTFDAQAKTPGVFNDVKNYILSHDRTPYLGVPTGFSDLDEYTGGYKSGKLYVIGGNPGQGKTTIMLASALAAARASKNAVVFSFEMTVQDLILLLACMGAKADGERMLRNELSDTERAEICAAVDELYEMPLIIYDLTMIDNTIEAVQNKVFALTAKSQCDAIYIDYLQLMTTRKKTNTTEEEVKNISRALKTMSIQARCPVIALSQLNRENMRRASKRPDVGDLRYSGAIQADADFIGLPYRPELYGIEEDEKGNSTRNVTEFQIGKFRQLGARVPTTLFWTFLNSNLTPIKTTQFPAALPPMNGEKEPLPF